MGHGRESTGALKKPFILKGLLNPEDVRRAMDNGVDGIVLSTHGGRQLDWSVAPLDVLRLARDIVGDRIALDIAGGVRRGTDLLKALALGADAVWVGRAALYGLCAAGAPGVARTLEIIKTEALDSMGLLGVSHIDHLGPHLLENVSPANLQESRQSIPDRLALSGSTGGKKRTHESRIGA